MGLSDTVIHRTAEAGIGWAALTLVLLSALAQGGNHPAVWTPLALAITVLFAALMLLRAGRPLPTALHRATVLALLCASVLAWALIQATVPAPPGLAHPVWSLAPAGSAPRISGDPAQTIHAVLRLGTYLMVGWIFAVTALPAARAWAFLTGIGYAMLAMAVFALGAAATGLNPALGEDAGLGGRLTGTFVNSNSFATYAAFGMLVNAALFLRAGPTAPASHGQRAPNTSRSRAVFATGAALCATSVVLTGSRGGILSAAFGLAVLLLAREGRRRAGLLAAAGVLALLIGTIIAGLALRAGATIPLGDSMAGRAHVYGALLANLDTRPWLGHGLGAFQDTFRPYLPLEASRREWEMAHSSYLETLWGMGLPAALVFYAALTRIGVRLWSGTRTRSRDRLVPALALAVFATGAAHATVDFSLQMPAPAALFAVLLGIGWAQSFGHRDRAAPPRPNA